MKFCYNAAVLLVSAAILSLCVAAAANDVSGWQQDQQLRAMADELARSKTLTLNDLDKPYFIQYTSDDADQVAIAASLGGILRSERVRLRRPGAVVRVGTYTFDSTNSIYSGNPRLGLFPIDDDYLAMRTSLWRATDALYKAATGEITAKRNALREISSPDKTPDFAAAKAVQIVDPVLKPEMDQDGWEKMARDVSARFDAYQTVLTSGVQVQSIASTYRIVNSEGTIVRIPETLNEIQIRSTGKAADGQPVWNHKFFVVPGATEFPNKEELAQSTDRIARETDELTKAPQGEDYSGPVLFEQEAAAEMMAQVFTDAVALHRKPLAPPGSNAGARILESVWAARLNSKVVPDWMSAVDDPLQEKYHGLDLAGHYTVDDEGVPAQRVQLIENGTLHGFLTSRMPVRNINSSNGHGRLPGRFGSQEAVIGNLFITASRPLSEPRLKAKLLERVKSAGLQYGLIVRRLDFPSTASLGDLQSMAVQLQRNGSARTLDQPLLVYRVYLNGREELLRGLRFGEFSAKDLRDIDAASDRPYVLNYVNDGTGLNIADMREEATTSSVICPSLLFDSVDLMRAENEVAAPPIVPPPALVASR